MKIRRRFTVIPSAAGNLLLLFLFLPRPALAQRPPEPDPELTLSEFRALLPAHPVDQNPEIAALADEIFFELLAAQGRVAAARQSLDRLDGWTKAAQARLDAQSAPLLDLEMLRFAEAKAVARLAHSEDERHAALLKANLLLGREPRSLLIALTTETHPPGAAAGTASQSADTFAARLARLQQLLPQAQNLLAKIYQNYLFGGIALTALLWQEEQVYQTELQYRLLLAEAERSRAVGD